MNLIALLLTATVSWAQDTPEPYDKAVQLVHDRYLTIDTLDPVALFDAAAVGLERGVDWLVIDHEGGRAVLRHAAGRKLGTVEVSGWEDLAEGLFRLEDTVRASGYGWGDVDLRLTTLAGMTTELDRYSRVLAGDSLVNFDTRNSGTLMGIGAVLRRVNGLLTVASVNDDGPAQRAGLEAGDVILRVDGVATTNMPVNDAVRRIRGERGSTVRLQLQRGARTWEASLQRDRVVIDNVREEILPGGIGYVAISNVSEQTEENLQLSLGELAARGALDKGLVLDLRGNTGGSMLASARTVDAFVTQGVVLTTAGRGGEPVPGLSSRIVARADGTEPKVGLVVLVDADTASGAEIISGSLQQLGRAVIIGTRTFGKGLVQKIYPLQDAMKLKLTVADYKLAQDRPVADVGVQPDVHLGHLVVTPDNVRDAGWDVAREQVAWEAIVPAVTVVGAAQPSGDDDGEDDEGGGAAPIDALDATRELARLALLRAASGSRDDVLAAVRDASVEVRATQLARFAEAMVARGLDWSPAPADGGAPEASLEASAAPDPSDPDVQILTATLRSPHALHRAMARLTCGTTSAWDDLVVPFGHVPAGGSVTTTTRVRLRRDVGPRADLVLAELHADRRPTATLPPLVLTAVSTPAPQLRVAARLQGTPQGLQAVVTLTNRTERDLDGVEAAFRAPKVEGFELIEPAWREPRIKAGKEVTFHLGLRRTDPALDELPLELVVAVDKHGAVFSPALPLHVSGREVVREAPVITAPGLPLTAAPGRMTVNLEVTDDHDVDAVVVFHNGEKVLFDDGDRSRLRLRAVVELVAGDNAIVVLARDDDGTRARHAFHVLGLSDDAPSAADQAPPTPAPAAGRAGRQG